MNELRKFLQRRRSPQHSEGQGNQPSGSLSSREPCHNGKHTRPDKDAKKKGAFLSSVQQELEDTQLQIAQLRQANALLHDQANKALVQNHETEAALLLANSQLEGFKVQCQEQAALVQAYRSSWMPSQQTSEDPNNNHWAQQTSTELPLIVQCLEKDTLRLNIQLRHATVELEELKSRTSQEISELKSQVNSLTTEIETLQSQVQQQKGLITEKDSLIHHSLVKLRDNEWLLAQARGQLEALTLHQTAIAQKVTEERKEFEETIMKLETEAITLKEQAKSVQQDKQAVLELKGTVSALRKTSQKLMKANMLLKQKHSSTATEVNRLSKKLRRVSQSPCSTTSQATPLPVGTDLLVVVKKNIEKVYKLLIGNIERGTEDEISFYSLSPLQLASAEKTLNKLMVTVSEYMELSATLRPETLPDQISTELFSSSERIKCVHPSDSSRKKYSLQKLTSIRRFID